MKRRLLLIFAVFFLAGCATGRYKPDNPKAKVVFADLNGDGADEIIERLDSDSGAASEITVKSNTKGHETIDSFSVPGKIRAMNLGELNMDGQNWIAISFDSPDGASNFAVYELNDNKLSKVFYTASLYGIQTDFSSTLSRIRIGKKPRNPDSPNLVPDWETWDWSGDRFVRQ